MKGSSRYSSSFANQPPHVERSADRLQQHALPDPAHAHLVTGHAKFLRQAHRLAATVLEKLGDACVTHDGPLLGGSYPEDKA
jgi:hypothetical protein